MSAEVKLLPLAGVRVVEFVHMVMGPTCGMVLADLGAEVIKIEPLAGDNTRQLLGAGAGFFPMFNRNKKSIALDLRTPQGLEVAHRLIATADVVTENFKGGTMKKLGLDYETLSRLNERLVYVSHKGFLAGPYSHRTALDEVVQMMGGLAYMTGRPGDPLRAGTSINDIMGGLFGALGVMAALMQRASTGKGMEVQAALFENNVFLVAQHMMQYAVTGQAARPMPERISAWGVYDVFTVGEGEQIFLGVVSETQWQLFCDAFGFDELKSNPQLATNNLRVTAREWLIPMLRERLMSYSVRQISTIFEDNGLPFAPIVKPHDLFDDPHLNESGGLADITLPDGRETRVPLLPFTLAGKRPGVRSNPPQVGEHSRDILAELGYGPGDIEAMFKDRIAADMPPQGQA